MSREFKFRVWDLKNFSWFESDKFKLNGKPDFVPNFYQEFEIQQFTGLKDKNGKEIYEGDIIKFAGLNYKVFWDEWKWDATCPYYCHYHWPRFDSDFKTNCSCGVVVGNIFENEDLLSPE